MKNPALSANLDSPSYKAKDTMDLLVHRARTTMRQKAPRGRKKHVHPGMFKVAYQSLKAEQRQEAERLAAEEAKKLEESGV